MNRRIKTPLVLQSHATECGAACLGSVLAYFGRWVQLNELRERCEVSRDGSSAAGIKRAAQHYGLECTGRGIEVTELHKYQLPLVLFWEFNHFVVLEGYSESHYYINDPSCGRREITVEDFRKSFSGIILEFKLGPQFKPAGSRPNLLKQIPAWLQGTSKSLMMICMCGLVLVIPALALPLSLSVFVDRVLNGTEPWGGFVVVTLLAMGVVCYVLTVLKQRWLKRLAVRAAVVGEDQCVAQMLRLPIDYFNHRLAGDLTARVQCIDNIAKSISEHFFELVLELLMSAVFLLVMLIFAPILALIVLALAVLNALVAFVLVRIQLDKSLALRREMGLFAGVGTLILGNNDMLRSTSADDHFFARWSGYQARMLATRREFVELGHVSSSMSSFFTIVANAAVLTFGAAIVIEGGMTMGTLVGFFVLASMFMTPVGRFVEFANQRLSIEADLQRLQDIINAPTASSPERKSSGTSELSTLEGRLKLTGNVEMHNITFGYNRSRPPTINEFSLTIKSGQRVAIVGTSGCGKSTLARLLSGLYEPWSGEILFDGYSRDQIPPEILSRSISVVDQNVSLFSATVRENIALWNPSIRQETVVAAARDASIHEEIISRPLGYATPVEEDGKNFSGGQKQRLEIARALAANPTLLILDEATSALDAATEEYIDDALRRRGMSCLIIAHRLSTIRDCDRIVVLNKGVEVQSGTHNELMQDHDGLYQHLVQAG